VHRRGKLVLPFWCMSWHIIGLETLLLCEEVRISYKEDVPDRDRDYWNNVWLKEGVSDLVALWCLNNPFPSWNVWDH